MKLVYYNQKVNIRVASQVFVPLKNLELLGNFNKTTESTQLANQKAYLDSCARKMQKICLKTFHRKICFT